MVLRFQVLTLRILKHSMSIQCHIRLQAELKKQLAIFNAYELSAVKQHKFICQRADQQAVFTVSDNPV